MTTTPASFKFNKVTTGMYDVEDRATGEALGEVYQNGALRIHPTFMWQVCDITQPDGVWIANSYITGLKTVHANRKDAGQELGNCDGQP